MIKYSLLQRERIFKCSSIHLLIYFTFGNQDMSYTKFVEKNRDLHIGHVVSLVIGLLMALMMLPCLGIVAVDGGLCQPGGDTSFPAWFKDLYIMIAAVLALTVVPLASHAILDCLIVYKLISFARRMKRFKKGICKTKFLLHTRSRKIN